MTRSSRVKSIEAELNTPLFKHESFARQATADDRIDRKLREDESLTSCHDSVLRAQFRLAKPEVEARLHRVD